MSSRSPETGLQGVEEDAQVSTPSHPVSRILWVPLKQVRANAWNPNVVAPNELRLLYHSIKSDGFTQPVVTMWNPEDQVYEIIDGFHRYLVCKNHKDIRESTGGKLPVVVIDKPINDRMASTVRHNRARGKHHVEGMAGIVFDMLDNGWDDAEVCAEMGMEPDELIRLKYVTGFAKLFENVEYRKAWETRRQVRLRRAYLDEHPDEDPRYKV